MAWSRRPVDVTLLWNNMTSERSRKTSNVEREVWRVAWSCWNHIFFILVFSIFSLFQKSESQLRRLTTTRTTHALVSHVSIEELLHPKCGILTLTYPKTRKCSLWKKKSFKRLASTTAAIRPNMSKFFEVYDIWTSVIGLTEFYEGVGASHHVNCANEDHKKGTTTNR